MLQQLDMFAMMAPPAPPATTDELAQIARIKAQRAAWEAERKRIDEAVAAGKAAGSIHLLTWGDAENGRGLWRKPGWHVQIVEHDGQVYASTRLEAANMGHSGLFSSVKGAQDIDGAIIHLCRNVLKTCAGYTDGGWRHETQTARQLAQLAKWIIELRPALASDWADIRAKTREETARRGTALRAAHKIKETAREALQAANVWAYDNLIVDTDQANRFDYQAQFRASWHVTGHGPDALELVIYGQRGLDPVDEPACDRALDALRVAMPALSARFAQAQEYALCYSDREKVTW